MPEGPELHLAGVFVNKVCNDRVFSGKVLKSAVSTKNPDVPWCKSEYTISATSRGKEVQLKLQDVKNKSETLSILFRFGMSGKFCLDHKNEMHKHAHLNFYSRDDDMVLSFVDFRRFGRWEINGTWGKQRGPCVLLEYDAFRENVLQNLEHPAFNRPICEALLNQRFFNGIGNYLRAEILYRTGIPPFMQAREVLQTLEDINGRKHKKNERDILQLCNILPTEVINLSGGKGYDPEATSDDDYSAFAAWLQCYYNPTMKNMVDNNKRTIWFSGPPGPMAPKESKSRFRKSKSHLDKKSIKEAESDEPEEKKIKSEKSTRGKVAKLAGKSKENSELQEAASTGKRKVPQRTRRTKVNEEQKLEIKLEPQSEDKASVGKRKVVKRTRRTKVTEEREIQIKIEPQSYVTGSPHEIIFTNDIVKNESRRISTRRKISK